MLQAQIKLPGMLMHCALLTQLSAPVAHSSISKEDYKIAVMHVLLVYLILRSVNNFFDELSCGNDKGTSNKVANNFVTNSSKYNIRSNFVLK